MTPTPPKSLIDAFPIPTPITFPLGGFGFDLTNRWTRMVMLGVGTDDLGFLGPRIRPSSSPMRHRTQMGMVFFVDGWHYTECDAAWLVTRARCIEWLQATLGWITTSFRQRNAGQHGFYARRFRRHTFRSLATLACFGTIFREVQALLFAIRSGRCL